MVGVGALAVVAVLSLSGCGEDDPEPVSVRQYRAKAEELCAQHGTVINEERGDIAGQTSDAEVAAFYRAEFVPRVRAIVQSLDAFGYPAEDAATYADASSRAFPALQEIQDDTYLIIDKLRRGELEDDDNPLVDLRRALTDLDVPCLPE